MAASGAPSFSQSPLSDLPIDVLFNEPIFRPGRGPWLHPFASAAQVDEETPAEHEGLVPACKFVLENLDKGFDELDKDLRSTLKEGWMESEWNWLRDIEVPAKREIRLYTLLWDTGIFNKIVSVKHSAATLAACGHWYGVVVKTLTRSDSLWSDIQREDLEVILAQIHPAPRHDFEELCNDLKGLSDVPVAELSEHDVVMKWQLRGWRQGVWMGEIWSEGASLDALKMMANVILVRFLTPAGEWQFPIDDLQGPLAYIRCILGGGRFSLEEWAPILRLLSKRSTAVVQDTLFAIAHAKDLASVRRRWADVLFAAKQHRDLKGEIFAPVLRQWVNMNDGEAAQFCKELRSKVAVGAPRCMRVWLLGRHFGYHRLHEVDGAYFSPFLNMDDDRAERVDYYITRLEVWRAEWASNRTEMEEYFHHFNLCNDSDNYKVMDLRTSFAVRHESFVLSGPQVSDDRPDEEI